MSQATVYVGLRENPSFIGPEPLGELAAVIARSEGRKSGSTSHRAEQLKLTRHDAAHLCSLRQERRLSLRAASRRQAPRPRLARCVPRRARQGGAATLASRMSDRYTFRTRPRTQRRIFVANRCDASAPTRLARVARPSQTDAAGGGRPAQEPKQLLCARRANGSSAQRPQRRLRRYRAKSRMLRAGQLSQASLSLALLLLLAIPDIDSIPPKYGPQPSRRSTYSRQSASCAGTVL